MSIKYRLSEVKCFLEEKGYNICYVGLYGSQNYGLDICTEEYQSDFDYKAVCIPTLRDLVNNSKPISKSYKFKGGLIDIKDIRIWAETLVKGNPAYLETLFTPYCIYSKDYEVIINERDNLVSEMGTFLLKACYGMILEKIKAFSHPYPTIKHKIDKFGYDPKQLHHIVRLFYLMENFINAGEFNMINNENIIIYLKKIKVGVYNLEEAEVIRDLYLEKAKKIREDYKVEPKFEAKKRIIQYSKDLIYNKIKNENLDHIGHTL